jgi:hypothetical protein
MAKRRKLERETKLDNLISEASYLLAMAHMAGCAGREDVAEKFWAMHEAKTDEWKKLIATDPRQAPLTDPTQE